MVVLPSETYSVKAVDGSVKFSSKDLKNRALCDVRQSYKTVLHTVKPGTKMNRGIRTDNREVYS